MIVPVGPKPPDSVAASVKIGGAVAPSVTAVGLGAVVIVGLAALDGHLLVGRVVVTDRAVVGVAAVAGVPLVGAGHRTGRRQRESGRRGVGAVAGDGDSLRVHQRRRLGRA